MKLNNQGWGLQELIVGIAILFFCLAFVSVMIHNSFNQLFDNSTVNNSTPVTPNQPNQEEPKEEITSYQQIEKTMTEACKRYNEAIYGEELLEGDKISVTVKSLVRDGYIEPIIDIKDNRITCSGYVTFIKNGNNVSYTPYLKCGAHYTTKGYLERLDAEI